MSLDKPLIDIIIPNGGGEVVGETIEGIFKYSNYPEDRLRIIVISQGKYGGLKYLRSISERKNIYVINKQFNIPPPIPYNDGLEFSSKLDPLSDFIHFLDDDLIPQESSFGWIDKFISFQEKWKFALCGAKASYVQDKKITEDSPVVPGVFGSGTFFFPRWLFDRIGYLDERIPWHCADNQYCVRTRLIEGLSLGVYPSSDTWFLHKHQSGTNVMPRQVHLFLKQISFEIFNSQVKEMYLDPSKWLEQHPLLRSRKPDYLFKYNCFSFDFRGYQDGE